MEKSMSTTKKPEKVANGPPAPPKEVTKSALLGAKSFADQQWQRAVGLLESNPSLVTYHILCMALKHHPPVNIITYMLQLNPKAAAVPKEGPTPLQVAVQHSCSLEVVKTILEACPIALVATNPGSHLDPLSYAKRFRPDEKDLIQLLSFSLGRWLPDKGHMSPPVRDDDDDDDDVDDDRTTAAGNIRYPSEPPIVSPPPTSRTRFAPPTLDFCVGPSPVATTVTSYDVPYKANGVVSKTNTKPNAAMAKEQGVSGPTPQVMIQDQQELLNVKQLCLAVVKGHKRLAKDIKKIQEESPKIWLSELQNQNDQQFRTQLIALDMKEKAMVAHFRRVQEELTRQVMDATIASKDFLKMKDRVENLTNLVQDRLKDLQGRVRAIEDARPVQAENAEFQTECNVGDGKTFIMDGFKTEIIGFSDQSPGSPTVSTSSAGSDDESPSPRRIVKKATPTIFCTPSTVHIDEDDEVRSLLSEEDVLHKKRGGWMGKRTPRWMHSMKDAGWFA